jgi:hypothetical protein
LIISRRKTERERERGGEREREFKGGEIPTRPELSNAWQQFITTMMPEQVGQAGRQTGNAETYSQDRQESMNNMA